MKSAAKKTRNSERGFTLFFAILISSLLLSIGLALFGITFKQLQLSAGTRNSQFAFFAADTGAECALYWDLKQNAFPTSTSPTSPIQCGGQNVTVTKNGFTWDFTIDPIGTTDECVDVHIEKTFAGDVTLESRGFNTCTVSDPRRVERGVRVLY